jgi:hypothetical protein
MNVCWTAAYISGSFSLINTVNDDENTKYGMPAWSYLISMTLIIISGMNECYNTFILGLLDVNSESVVSYHVTIQLLIY